MAECASSGWNRVKAFENLGATAVEQVTPGNYIPQKDLQVHTCCLVLIRKGNTLTIDTVKLFDARSFIERRLKHTMHYYFGEKYIPINRFMCLYNFCHKHIISKQFGFHTTEI